MAPPGELPTEAVEEFMSISDGQLVLEAGGAAAGRYAANPRLSITRIGSRWVLGAVGVFGAGQRWCWRRGGGGGAVRRKPATLHHPYRQQVGGGAMGLKSGAFWGEKRWFEPTNSPKQRPDSHTPKRLGPQNHLPPPNHF